MPFVIIQYIMHKYGGKTEKTPRLAKKKEQKENKKREQSLVIWKMQQISFLLVVMNYKTATTLQQKSCIYTRNFHRFI